MVAILRGAFNAQIRPKCLHVAAGLLELCALNHCNALLSTIFVNL